MKKLIVALTLIASVFALSSCKKETKDEPKDESVLAKTSWVYMVPDDSDGGKMALTFLDETNCFLVNGDKEGWWWAPEDGYMEGTYTFTAEENSGVATFVVEGESMDYPFVIEGEQLGLGGMYIMSSVEFFTQPE